MGPLTESVQCHVVPVLFGQRELLIQLKIYGVVSSHLKVAEI